MTADPKIPIVDPSLGDLFALAGSAGGDQDLGDLPAQVIMYDAPTQMVDVQPLVLIPRGGTLKPVGPIQGIQVRWPAGFGGSITFPLNPGDPGWVRPAGADISAWKMRGVTQDTQAIPRRQDPADAVFEPGSRPQTDPLSVEQWHATAMVIFAQSMLMLGDSLATDFVALKAKVEAELQKCVDDFNTLNAHLHAAGTLLDSLGNPCTGAVAVGPATAYAAVSPVGATKVKAT